MHRFTSIAIFAIGFPLAALSAPPQPQPKPQPAVVIAQNTQRTSYREIPLGNISSPLTGNNPRTVALRAFTYSQDAPRSQQVQVSRPTANTAVVMITKMGLEDDSVAGIRYRVELRRTGQQWRIVWAGSQTRCQARRGHQNWSRQLCV